MKSASSPQRHGRRVLEEFGHKNGKIVTSRGNHEQQGEEAEVGRQRGRGGLKT